MSNEAKLRSAYEYYHKLLRDKDSSGSIVQQAANLYGIEVHPLVTYIEGLDGVVESARVQMFDIG